MKQFITLILLIAIFVNQTYAQCQKTLTKSIATKGNQHINLALDGKIKVSQWEENFIRVTLTIDVANFNDNILSRLIQIGRYSIKSYEQNGALLIKMPKIAHKVIIKGQQLKENISYQIDVPKNTFVDIDSPKLNETEFN